MWNPRLYALVCCVGLIGRALYRGALAEASRDPSSWEAYFFDLAALGSSCRYRNLVYDASLSATVGCHQSREWTMGPKGPMNVAVIPMILTGVGIVIGLEESICLSLRSRRHQALDDG